MDARKLAHMARDSLSRSPSSSSAPSSARTSASADGDVAITCQDSSSGDGGVGNRGDRARGTRRDSAGWPTTPPTPQARRSANTSSKFRVRETSFVFC